MTKIFIILAVIVRIEAILFSNLVKDLLGLDAVLLDYPNISLPAVRSTKIFRVITILLDGKNILFVIRLISVLR